MDRRESSTTSEGSPNSPARSWDVGIISRALNREPDLSRDPAYGPGLRYALADEALVVELFPPHVERLSGVIRLTTATSRQEFYHQPQPAVRDEGLVFETGNLVISLSPDGEATTHLLASASSPVAPPDASPSSTRPNTRDDEDEGRTSDPAALQAASRNPSPGQELQPRVAYGGRLGAAPRTKTTPKGKFVMEFPVAVTVEGREKPEWRDTVVFDAKARALDGELDRGAYVDVVAYEHTRLRKDPKTGATRETREYYATSVTPKPRTRPDDGGARDGQRP